MTKGKEKKQEEKLLHVVDRFGILPYGDTKAIVVNKKDAEKASEALSEQDILHRTFDSVYDLADEAIAEKAIVGSAQKSDLAYAVAVIHREGYAANIDTLALAKDHEDPATDFLHEKGVTLKAWGSDKDFIAAPTKITIGKKAKKAEKPVDIADEKISKAE